MIIQKTALSLFGMLCLLSLVALPALPAHAEENPHWRVCLLDSDCVVVGAGCMMQAVNKQHQAQADAYFREQNAARDCAALGPATSIRCRRDRAACLHPNGQPDPESPCMRKEGQCEALFGLQTPPEDVKSQAAPEAVPPRILDDKPAGSGTPDSQKPAETPQTKPL